MKYKVKSSIIEAIRYTGNNFKDIKEFTEGTPIKEPLNFIGEPYGIIYLDIPGEERQVVKVGDYIVKVENKLYPCNVEVFEMLFKEVKE